MDNKVSYGDMAALDGQVVTEGHVKWCATFGHANYSKDGVDSDLCPRCGEDKTLEAEADELLKELLADVSPEYLEAARNGDLATCLDIDLN